VVKSGSLLTGPTNLNLSLYLCSSGFDVKIIIFAVEKCKEGRRKNIEQGISRGVNSLEVSLFKGDSPLNTSSFTFG
jgi:hypothetical protein